MSECRCCGADNRDENNFCDYCGSILPKPVEPPPPRQVYRTAYEQTAPDRPQYPPDRPHVKNWLVESILVTVLCCIPLGIGGIINATRVDKLVAEGDIHGARSASTNAMWFVMAAAVLGFLSMVVLIVSETLEYR